MGFEKGLSPKESEADYVNSNEEEYRNIIKHAPIGIYEMDFYGTKFRSVNERFCQVLGYSEEELLDMSPLALLSDDSRKDFQDKVKDALTGTHRDEFFSSAEFEAKTKNGQSVWGLLHSKVKFKDGKPDSVLVFIQDITERKKAEDVLRQNERLYRTFCDNNEDGFILLEPLYDESGKASDFRFLEVNHAYECQTGRKATFVKGKRAVEVAPDLEPEWISLVGKVAKTGKAVRYENFNRRTNRWYDAHYFPFDKGQVGILFRDITERKETEKALNKKQQELDLILDSSPTIIFYKDREGKFIQANRAFAEALNTTKEKLLGKTVFDLYSAEIAQGMANDDFVVIESRCPKMGIVEPYESPTGLRWIRTDKIPSFDENGNVTGIVGFSEEITDRKKAEEALRMEKERYMSLANSLPDIVFETDINGKVIFANQRGFEITGYTKEDLAKGFDVFTLIAPQDKEKALEDFKKTLNNQPIPHNEYTVARKDGSTFPAIVVTSLIVENQHPIGLRGLAIDITERKKLEKQMKDQERLAAIGATAGMVGHDIRNPLQAIVSDTFLLRLDLAVMSDVATKGSMVESLASIDKNVAYINKIVQDLQDYAKPVVLEEREIDLKSLISDVLVKKAIPENIDASFDIQGDSRSAITDPALLKRILANLVNNAVQAMPEGGKLTIRTYREENHLVLNLQDSGAGIPEEIKDRIFTPLFTTKSKGQGFGLAVVKRMTEALGGTVTFESEEGKGTIFIIRLPQPSPKS